MRDTLEQRQAEMKERQELQQEEPQRSTMIDYGNEQRPLCANCQRRICRRGSALCSRCTVRGIERTLRDTLPGMEVEEKQIEKPSEWVGREILSHTEKPKNTIINEIQEVIDPTQLRFNRRQVAKILGVSPTSIYRWEIKGAVPMPKKMSRTGQCFYTEDDIKTLQAYKDESYILSTAVARTPQERAARAVVKKTFSINKGMERAVSQRINLSTFRGNGKLV